MPTVPEKICPVCGRAFTWRKKWARTWDRVVYCSERCRRQKAGSAHDLESAILKLLGERAVGATICPSEILPAEAKQEHARMEEVRAAARRLVQRGEIEIVQKGTVVDPDRAHGPIRLRRKRSA